MPENLFKYEKTCCQHGPTTKFGGQWPARAGKPQARDPPRRKQKILFDQELKLVASPTKKATKNPVCSDYKEEVLFLNII